MFRTKFNNKYVNKLSIATPKAVADYFISSIKKNSGKTLWKN